MEVRGMVLSVEKEGRWGLASNGRVLEVVRWLKKNLELIEALCWFDGWKQGKEKMNNLGNLRLDGGDRCSCRRKGFVCWWLRYGAWLRLNGRWQFGGSTVEFCLVVKGSVMAVARASVVGGWKWLREPSWVDEDGLIVGVTRRSR